MKTLKSHFLFNKQQKSGIFFLLVLNISLLSFYNFYDFGREPVFDICSSEVINLQTEIDSLRLTEIEARKPKVYPFNPNFMTDFKAYTLGMSPTEFDRLKHFRSRDKWVNSSEEFKKVTAVSDSLFEAISPYFKFPEWVTNPKPRKAKTYGGYTEKPEAQKIDLNVATEAELQQVSGVGDALSKRIVNYREKIGGFSGNVQLHSVWGLRPEVVERILNLFSVKSPKKIIVMNLNVASASDIATIPGVSFDLAKAIWEFRVLREHIDDISALEKIEGVTPTKLKLIQLYLSVD